MSILKVNDIRRATTGSAALVINDPVIITTGSISASALVGNLPGGVSLADASVGKEKLTNDARDWVNILNKPAGIISSSTQIIPAVSGAIITPASITASSTIATRGSFSGSGALLYNIPNSALTNNSITINGVSTALGTSRTLTTNDISESVNLYYTDARVKAKLNLEGIVSSSGQINYQSVVGQPSVNTLGSDGNNSFTVTAGIFLTGSTGINLTTDSPNAKLTIKTVGGTVSSSAQVKDYLPGGTVSSSDQVSYLQLSNIPGGIVSSSGQVDVRNTTGITTIATTGSNTFEGNQTISGSVTLTGNLTVQGTSSILYTTSSQIDVGTNKITIGTNQSLRFGGLSVVDSGSVNHSGSLYWDSLNNHWIYENVSTAPYNSAMLIAGPKNTGTLGNEIGLTINKIPVASGEDHISDSQISDNGSFVGITGNLQVTGSITASGVSGVNYTSLTNIPSNIVSSSGQVRANQTDNFTTDVQQVLTDTTVHSGSFLGTATTNNLTEGFTNLYYTDVRVKTKLDAEGVHSGSSLGSATTTNLVEGTNLYFTNQRVVDALPTNTLSSSIQVRDFLPANTVSSSAQINLSQAFDTASQALTASYALVTVGTTATNTDSLPQGSTNLYYSDTLVKNKLDADNVHSGSFLGTATTTNLTEGINLYFTNQRVVNALPINTVSSSTQYPGWVTASSQIDYNSIQNKLSGVVSSSTQVQPLLPGGTVSSSVQYPGWVTASSQIDYNSIQNKLSGVISSSTQFNALTGTSASYALTASFALATSGVVQNAVSASYAVTSSYVSAAGIVSNSSQIDYNSIQNKLSGVVSSSAQVKPLLPAGTVSSSVQVVPFPFTGSADVSGSLSVVAQTNSSIRVENRGSVTGSLNVSATAVQVGSLSPTLVQFMMSNSPRWELEATNGYLVPANDGVFDFGIVSRRINRIWANDIRAYAGAFINSRLVVTGSAEISGAVTASGLTANQAVFTNASDGLVSNPITGTGNVVMSASPTLTGTIGINTPTPSASLHVSGTMMVQQIIEHVIRTGSAPTSTTNLDITSGSLHYRSGSTTAHWTLNFRGDAGTTLNSMMYNNQSLTVALIVNQGATVYSASAHQIDGVSITPRWQSGLTPTSSANSTDIYTYTIIKVASASYNLFASQTRFA